MDYTITVPASASVDVRSISGNVRVTNVQGVVRGESVSGDITMTGTPLLENAKTVSGDVSLDGVSSNADLYAGSGSGDLIARNLKVRGLDLSSIVTKANLRAGLTHCMRRLTARPAPPPRDVA